MENNNEVLKKVIEEETIYYLDKCLEELKDTIKRIVKERNLLPMETSEDYFKSLDTLDILFNKELSKQLEQIKKKQ